MSGMDGKISNRDMRWWLKELARPHDAVTTTRTELPDWESRARAQGWQPARPLVNGSDQRGRHHRHLRRKG